MPFDFGYCHRVKGNICQLSLFFVGKSDFFQPKINPPTGRDPDSFYKTAPVYLKEREHDWWKNEKPGDWTEGIFREFYNRIQMPMEVRKGTFNQLIPFLKIEEVDQEIGLVLNEIHELLKS